VTCAKKYIIESFRTVNCFVSSGMSLELFYEKYNVML